MATYEWICRECNIWWDRELPMATAPSRTKCPKCKKLSNRYWQQQGVAVKFGDDMDFHTVRARNKKGQYVGDDASTPDVDESRTTVRVKKSTLTLPDNAKKPKKSRRERWK